MGVKGAGTLETRSTPSMSMGSPVHEWQSLISASQLRIPSAGSYPRLNFKANGTKHDG